MWLKPSVDHSVGQTVSPKCSPTDDRMTNRNRQRNRGLNPFLGQPRRRDVHHPQLLSPEEDNGSKRRVFINETTWPTAPMRFRSQRQWDFMGLWLDLDEETETTAYGIFEWKLLLHKIFSCQRCRNHNLTVSSLAICVSFFDWDIEDCTRVQRIVHFVLSTKGALYKHIR